MGTCLVVSVLLMAMIAVSLLVLLPLLNLHCHFTCRFFTIWFLPVFITIWSIPNVLHSVIRGFCAYSPIKLNGSHLMFELKRAL